VVKAILFLDSSSKNSHQLRRLLSNKFDIYRFRYAFFCKKLLSKKAAFKSEEFIFAVGTGLGNKIFANRFIALVGTKLKCAGIEKVQKT